MNIGIGLKNGFCFGVDISACNDVIIKDEEAYLVDGIVFTIGPVEIMFGAFVFLGPATEYEFEDGGEGEE